jgi:hypothetical protein
MFKEKTLRPVAVYGRAGKRDLQLEYDKESIHIDLFANIFKAEYRLREIVQQERSLESKARATKKAVGNEKEAARYEEELTDLRRRYSEAEHDFYLAQTIIPPGPLRRSYNTLRENPTWYLREELVDDCVKRGGCCSRKCGCCQHRHEETERDRGTGHCTPSCGCCAIVRGFEYTTAEKDELLARLTSKMYEANNPGYITYLARALFMLPKKKGTCFM